MRRREFIALLGGAAAASARPALAQPSSKTFRLGTLTPAAPISEKSPFGTLLLQGLAQRGYALGKNLALDAQGAMGEVGKLPELVRDMKRGGADVIVVVGYPTALACKVENMPKLEGRQMIMILAPR